MAYGIPALAGRLFNPLVRAGQRILPKANPRFAPASMLDTITNPKTYSGLADDATDALGQLLPKQFRGAGFQNVPTNALNALDDLRNLPAGPIKEMAQRKAAQQFSKAAGSGTVRIPVIPTGGQRVVPGTVTMLDDVVRGSLKTPGALNNLGKLTKSLPVVGPALSIGGEMLGGRDPLDAVGAGIFGTVGGGLGMAGYGALGLPTGPGAVASALVGGGIGYNAGTSLYDAVKPNFMDFIQNPEVAGGMPGASTLGTSDTPPRKKPGTSVDSNPQQGADLDMDAIRREAATAEALNKYQEREQQSSQKPQKPQRPAVGPTPNYQLDPQPRVQAPPPGAPPNTPTVIPGTPIPQMPSTAARPYAPADQSGNIGATYGNGTSTMPNANVANTVLPPNAEQILQADPMQIYEQARKAAVGQDQSAMNKVRDLGLAIHRQKFPGLYTSDNSVPGSMTVKDEDEALTEIEPSQIDQALLGIYSGQQPVLDPNKFLDLQLSGRIIR